MKNRNSVAVLWCALIAVFAGLFVAEPVLAQSPVPYCAYPFEPCNPDKPGSKCFQPRPPSCKCYPKDCKKCTASPGFVGTGAYEISAVDLSIPTNGFPLEAGRRYSSHHSVDGPTGVGWSSSFHARIHYTTYLFAAPSTYQTAATVIMPDGVHYDFVDSGSGTFAPPEGRYDTLTRLIDGSFELVLQRSRSKMIFSSAGLLTSVVDDYGNTLTFTYDTSDRLERVADASGSGRFLDVFWGSNGRISTIQDNSGRTVQYTYDTNGMLTGVTNPAGQVTTYTYVTGRFARVLSRIQDHWGRTISDITWDVQGRVKTYSENGETFTYSYAHGSVETQTAKTDSVGNQWRYPFTADGLISERHPPTGTASSTTYYADGSVQLSTDEVGVKTFYTYTGQGRVASVTKDYQGTSAVRFDYTYDTNFPEKVTSVLPKDPSTGAYDGNWQGWVYDYYAPGSTAPGALHHVYRVRTDGVTLDTMTTYAYDAKGRVLSTTDAVGSVTDYVYDMAGNLSTVTAPSNNDAGTRPMTTYGYDALGRVTSVTLPLTYVTTYTYDVLDRIATVTIPKPTSGSSLVFTTTYSYDNWDVASGLTSTHVTDPNAIVTKQSFDQFGRLRKSIDGLSQATQYGYVRDLLSSITDANNNATSYEYNALKRLSATVFPNAARETYVYRADGLLQSRTDRKNQTVSFTYDAQKRLTRKTYPNSSYIEFTYVGQKLTQVYDNSVSPAETHTFTYDTALRMSTNTQGPRGTISYTYTAGDATATTVLTGGPSTSFTYYPDGRLNTLGWSVVTGQFKYAYRANGQYDSITMPNNQSRAFAYDDQGRLTQIANAHPTAGNLATYDYAYDLNHATAAYTRLGRRVSTAITVPAQTLSAALTKYHYDGNYQLTKAEFPAATPFNSEVHDWTYDATGNRLISAVNGTVTSYTYAKNGTNPNNWQRLLTAGTTSYTYDNNGNTLTESTSTYGWDYENRMTSISGAVSATYKYDYEGRRTGKTVGGVTTTYMYDGLNLVGESGAATRNYVFGPGIDEPLALAASGSTYYYSVDGLGSVSVMTDAAGVVQNHYTYDVWGTQRSVNEAVAQPFRYTSREVGDVVNQWFYRARFYAPANGRFSSEDGLLSPQVRLTLVGRINQASSATDVTLAEATNAYTYVLNQPVQFRDPTGFVPQVPGCDWVPCIESDRLRDCCYEHDKCFEDKGCSWPSWFWGELWPSPCSVCNARQVRCVVGARRAGKAPDSWKRRAAEIDPNPAEVWSKVEHEAWRRMGPRVHRRGR
jgi:RHS repeat-associated protein